MVNFNSIEAYADGKTYRTRRGAFKWLSQKIHGPDAHRARLNDYFSTGPIQKAIVKKEHLRHGEVTARVERLARVINDRGLGNDDAGHIVACSLGGKMIDINLLPQNKHLNRGLQGNYLLWRELERCMHFWVNSLPEECNPRLSYQMLLRYGDEENPHRPDKFEYNIQFELDDEESDATENEDTDQIRDGRHLFNVATVVLECPIEEASKLEPRIKSEIAFMSKKVKRHA
ncbi:unnamed protein product [Rotaria socialis]|uniref:Uncharacterized protein n=1 Tax=Rotaria socialis TaxID=392032 RepID=A0A821WFA0_9BILA|nr:unnamed protein product [Rotaria socialis]